MLQDFKKFAMRGNVIDLAVGVIIGGAFGKIVASLVEDVLMPLIGLFSGGIDLSGLALTVGGAKVRYGAFIQAGVDFLIIAFVIFLMVRAVNKLYPPTPTVKECPRCFMTIPIRATRCPHCTSELKAR